MSEDLGFDNNVLSNKLKHYFKDSIKMSLKTKNKIFIVTKNDIFYMIINIPEISSDLFPENDDYSIIEKMRVKELCFKKIIDLTYGRYHFIAKSEDNKFFCVYIRKKYLINGRTFEKLESFDSDSNSNNDDSNKISSSWTIISVKCGSFHSLALTQKEVYAWGYNKQGQIGNGSFDEQDESIKLDCFEEEIVIGISCGAYHSMALTNKGHIFSWGYNEFGQFTIIY
jgi:alpha-tubulin suppressor-like RCC1 family protein